MANPLQTVYILVKAGVLLTISALLGGCGALKQSLYQDYAAPSLASAASSPDAAIKKIEAALTQDDDTGKACFGKTTASVKDGKESKQVTDCRAWRNAATAALMANSDEVCVAHMRTIYGNEAAYNVTFGTITNYFAGAATVVEKVSQKSLFSALALFSNAERSLINESVYKTAVVSTVSKKIRESRELRRNAILNHLRNDALDAYPVNQAISDVLDYHNTCSFMYGLERAIEEGSTSGAEHRRQALESELRRLMGEAVLIAQDGNDSVKTAYRTGLEERIKAIHAELKVLTAAKSEPSNNAAGQSGDGQAKPASDKTATPEKGSALQQVAPAKP